MIKIKEEQSLDQSEMQRIYHGLVATDPKSQPRNYEPLPLRNSCAYTDEQLMMLASLAIVMFACSIA